MGFFDQRGLKHGEKKGLQAMVMRLRNKELGRQMIGGGGEEDGGGEKERRRVRER